MRDNSPCCDPELAYLVRMVLRGRITPEQVQPLWESALKICARSFRLARRRSFRKSDPDP
jgi:hypothetical protein